MSSPFNLAITLLSNTEMMTHIHAETSSNRLQIGFYALSILFNLCLIAQVLTVGLAYFYKTDWWNIHVLLVRGYSALSLILLGYVFLFAFPQRVRILTISLPILLGLQFLTIHLKTSLPIAVFHPLIGFSLLSVSSTLVHRVGRVLFPNLDQES
ncbi:hypothetical protein NIES2135_57800 [Leptolyngbya boryana NIES-2135]|jgi:hypothetical protein|uniref:Uncharacterized protein n=2 Tax=Leptolyngbya TaxID=47251 RepID=A0A1Z4JQ46_LEPBY|nr:MULTISPECIES: DUF6220 domain-containing protein [Leptolyngbya]ULP29958.1 DUF6220 domain-containing protein [Leptolyngbya boryana IU 594]BAS54954.1 hypothetical protein LBWT_8550 [Leptolyngbya boryana IAM M-101]BAS61302.1 hypothetical protein LBDG_08550 [Leptolyngbya boryana dg5]BAY58905.1 hypothetical protein NIES2135_57800 [Leptolyngbya boryana NIES-2135]